MFHHLLAFFIAFVLPAWMQNHNPDEHHFYRRMFTKKHQAKRSKIKPLWIGMCFLIMLFPYPPVMVALLLFTTFLTFSFMDESN